MALRRCWCSVSDCSSVPAEEANQPKRISPSMLLPAVALANAGHRRQPSQALCMHEQASSVPSPALSILLGKCQARIVAPIGLKATAPRIHFHLYGRADRNRGVKCNRNIIIEKQIFHRFAINVQMYRNSICVFLKTRRVILFLQHATSILAGGKEALPTSLFCIIIEN